MTNRLGALRLHGAVRTLERAPTLANSPIAVLQGDFAQVVLLHQIDELPHAVDVEYRFRLRFGIAHAGFLGWAGAVAGRKSIQDSRRRAGQATPFASPAGKPPVSATDRPCRESCTPGIRPFSGR